MSRAGNHPVKIIKNSRASGKKFVSPELKQQVLITIDKMGYKPSRLAQSLKINRTNFIGLMVPDITNPYFAERINMMPVKFTPFFPWSTDAKECTKNSWR